MIAKKTLRNHLMDEKRDIRFFKKTKKAGKPAYFYIMVGAMGFEPMTSCSQSKRATKLRNAPIA